MAKKVYSIPAGAKQSPTPTARTIGTAEPHPLAGCHVSGILVEMLPPERLVGLFWKQTDEGIAASNVGKVPRSESASVISDPLQKALERKRDFSNNESEPWLAPDPMQPLANEHIAPGMRPRFLSEARLNKEGNYTRGFEVVLGHNGDPVKLGTLVLAQMPEEKAERRNKYFQAKGNDKVKAVYQSARKESEGLVRTARDLGIPVPAGEEYEFEEHGA